MLTRLHFDRGTLILEGIAPGDLEKLFSRRTWRNTWKWDGRVSAWRSEACNYAAVRTQLASSAERTFVDDVPIPIAPFFRRIELPEPSPEQLRALSGWDESKRRGILILPEGRIRMETALLAAARAKTSALIVTPGLDDVHPWHRRILRAFQYDAGILAGDASEVRAVTVTTYRRACIHMEELGAGFGLIIFDEARCLTKGYHREAALMCAAPWRLGLLQDPMASEKEEALLKELVGPALYWMKGPLPSEGMPGDPRVKQVRASLSSMERRLYVDAREVVRRYIEKRRKRDESYSRIDLGLEKGSDPDILCAQKAYGRMASIRERSEGVLDALEEIFRRHEGERVIVFAPSDGAAMKISRRFLIPALIDHVRKPERLAYLRDFAQGRIRAFVVTRTTSEDPFDLPAKIAVAMGGPSSLQRAKGYLRRFCEENRRHLYEILCDVEKESIDHRL